MWRVDEMKALDFLLNLKQSGDFDGNLEAFLDEAIAELESLKFNRREWYQKGCRDGSKEALQQPKSCAKCKAFKLDDEHNDGFGQCFWGIHFPNGNSSSYHKGIDFYCSEFEAKEQ